MRWPIRFQFLVPMACLVVGALVAVSLWNGILAGQRTRQQIEHDLQEVAQTLSDASFPLTDTVLGQVASLSGSEFIYCDARGVVLATSAPDLPVPLVASSDLLENASAIKLGPRIVIGTQGYYHTPLRIRGHAASGSPAVLHMLYPQRDYQQAWRHAFFPPLLIGALAIVLVSLLGTAIASRVTRPLHALQAQVDEISRGNFRQLPEPARDDEVADLSRSVNRMAETLTLYENQVRRSEQLRTLGQLGSGIGHQMRNSVTGCRLAIQLHARECPSGDACESLAVAERQLDLMEQHVRRFLVSGRAAPTAHRRVDLRDVVESVVSLVQPTTRHLAVDVDWRRPAEAAIVSGHAEDLEQLLINLMLNAIEAASRLPTADTSTPQPATAARSPERSPNRPRVEICIRRAGDRILLDVADSGRGPAAELQATLFDAFISDKPEGTGLGLSVARQIAIDHQGELRWDRHSAMTRFTLDLPSMNEDR